jgi:hypothetical protein
MAESPTFTTSLEITYVDPDDAKKIHKFDCGQASFMFDFTTGARAPLTMHCTFTSTHYLPALLRLLQEQIAFTCVLGNPTLHGTVERTGFRCDVMNGLIEHLHLSGEHGLESIELTIKVTDNPEFHFIGHRVNPDGTKKELDDVYRWKTA